VLLLQTGPLLLQGMLRLLQSSVDGTDVAYRSDVGLPAVPAFRLYGYNSFVRAGLA